MTAQIDYSKYSNMSERQLLNSLLTAEKNQAKIKAELQKKLENSSNLISFLKTELKARIDRPRYNFIAYEKSNSYKKAREYELTLNNTQKAEIDKELENEVNKDYGNEL